MQVGYRRAPRETARIAQAEVHPRVGQLPSARRQGKTQDREAFSRCEKLTLSLSQIDNLDDILGRVGSLAHEVGDSPTSRRKKKLSASPAQQRNEPAFGKIKNGQLG
jgi:hypothetical protein